MATAIKTGSVTQIIGSTFDAEFPELPPIYNAVKVEASAKGVDINVTGEVQQHLGGGRVRCVALGSTDGMVRGMDVVDTGSPVSVPVKTSATMNGCDRKRSIRRARCTTILSSSLNSSTPRIAIMSWSSR